MSNNITDCPITTNWYASFNPDNPLPEYPRPQLERQQWQSLNGYWQYAIRNPKIKEVTDYDGLIVVPYCLESKLSGVGRKLLPNERLWYHRNFDIPEVWNYERIILHFGAVDWQCSVIINGVPIAYHQGGYLPFSIDITKYIKPKKNDLTVIVSDPTDTHWQQKGKQRLNPRGIFYTPCSGIWQTVWIEPVKDNYITSLKITPTLTSIYLQVNTLATTKAEIIITSQEGIQTHAIEISTNEDNLIEITNPHLWCPEDPYLYDLQIKLANGDQAKSYFGLRTFSLIKDKDNYYKLGLNNQVIFQFGPLDQGYWPEGNYTPPTYEAEYFDIAKMKELGFNMLRKHTKVESSRWYYTCDKLGMIVWQDMIAGGKCQTDIVAIAKNNLKKPNPDNIPSSYRHVHRSLEESRQDYENELTAMINHLYNFTSIAMWVPFNEHWGQFDANRITDLIRKLDSTRLIDQASGWVDQGQGDMNSYHMYFDKLKKSTITDSRAFIISECGGFGLYDKEHSWTKSSFSYAKFKTQAALLNRYRNFIEKEVLPLKKFGLAAVCYTQLSDVEMENNGIYTYDRKVLKMDKDELTRLNLEVYK